MRVRYGANHYDVTADEEAQFRAVEQRLAAQGLVISDKGWSKINAQAFVATFRLENISHTLVILQRGHVCLYKHQRESCFDLKRKG